MIPPRMRLYLLLTPVLVGLAIGAWVYWIRPPTLPEIPSINLAGADPAVAEAITRAREELLKAPRSAKAWRYLAMTLHAHNYEAEALPCYSAVALLEPKNPLWPYLHGDILSSGTQPETALPYLKRSADLSPPNSLARLRLADLLMQLSQYDKAAAEYRKVLDAEPRNDHAQFGLGQIALVQKQYEEAIRYLRAVDKCPYARNRARALRAAAYTNLGNAAAADRERKLLAELPPDAVWPDEARASVADLQVGLRVVLRNAEHLLNNDKTPMRLLQLLGDAVMRYPESDQVWLYLGKALANAKDFDGAEKALQKSIQLAPRNGEGWLALGALRQVLRQFKEAANAYREAIKVRPTDAFAHFQLGVCLQEQGDKTGAAESFRQALRFRPDLAEAHQRLTALKVKS